MNGKNGSYLMNINHINVFMNILCIVANLLLVAVINPHHTMYISV